MTHRVVTRVLAATIAAGLVVLGGVGAVDALATLISGGPVVAPWDTWYERVTTSWLADQAFATGAALGVVGLALVVAGLWPRRRVRLVPLDSRARRLRWHMRVDDLEDALERAAVEVAGVRKARVRHADDLARVRVRASRSDVDAVEHEVARRVQEVQRLQRLPAPARVVVHVVPTK